MLDVSFGGAFIAGLLSFLAPCVLPIVPPYLAWLTGLSFDQLSAAQQLPAQRRRIILSALFFVFGFATVFVALGATATVIGQALARYFDILSIVAGLVIIVMGLHFLGLLRFAALYREARITPASKPAGLVGAYVMGLAFAFGWTPCVGPVLAAILFVAGAEESALHGAALLATYALGLGLPFLLAAAFIGRFITWAGRFRRHLKTVEQVMGALLVVTGVLFATGQMANISYWLLEAVPAFQRLG